MHQTIFPSSTFYSGKHLVAFTNVNVNGTKFDLGHTMHSVENDKFTLREEIFRQINSLQ